MIKKTRLIVVENERAVAAGLKAQLRELGYRIGAVVTDGKQAVQCVADLMPDLVLMSIHLPNEMDGIASAIEIQSRYQTPVILMGSMAEDSVLLRALDSRPYGYLVKPYEMRELHAMIQMALARRLVELAVEHSELRLQQAIEAADLAMLEWGHPSNQLMENGRLSRLFNRDFMPIDQSAEEFLVRIDAEQRESVARSLRETLTNGETVRVEFRTSAAFGGERILEAYAKIYRTQQGNDRIISIVRDITNRNHDDDFLRHSSAMFRTTPEAIVVTNEHGRIVTVNAAFSRITGFSEQEAIGADPDVLLRVERSSDRFMEKLTSSNSDDWQGEVFYRRRDDELFPAWQSLSVTRDADGRVTHVINAFSDVSKLHRVTDRLEHMAHHDPLTGLPNRLLINDRVEHAIAQAQRDCERCVLLFLDLDGFKAVNDTLGHAAGDELLKTVAVRLTRVLRQSDTIGRLGGDEFIIVTGDSKPEYAADMVMYAVKQHGRNGFRFFSASLTERAGERLSIEQGLRQAIDYGTLVVHYQPQISLDDGGITGVEALVRWRHPELGVIEPTRFIPVAEDSGVIDRLGLWVLRRACQEIKDIRNARNRQLRLSVNVSVGQFLHHDFLETLRIVLTEENFPPDALDLEITESTLQVIEQGNDILNSLAKLGVTLSLDHFGAGYSSLGTLRRQPIKRIKIDPSFIVGLPQEARDESIVQAMVALSNAMKMSIVGEGVERAEQALFLYRMGCTEGQGFLFSRPLSRADLVELLAQSKGHLDFNGHATLH
ncbi:EAL domain-containing protein [Denitratisoma sp. DHT3]|uniref:two-component system response regulator n=1 Tax=Denitratisoma sp. DHT3 TaxID=1981880 RepID=UPI0021BD8397|nr:EAL domain-containing protein [Denitratisoma sp. DHT3]